MAAGCEILSVAESRAAGRAAEARGVASLTLLENAGGAVANAVAERFEPQPVLVLCGPGLNGGDGYVAALERRARGSSVRIAALAEPKAGDALQARQAWDGPVAALGTDPKEARLVVDALFGAGLARPLAGPA